MILQTFRAHRWAGGRGLHPHTGGGGSRGAGPAAASGFRSKGRILIPRAKLPPCRAASAAAPGNAADGLPPLSPQLRALIYRLSGSAPASDFVYVAPSRGVPADSTPRRFLLPPPLPLWYPSLPPLPIRLSLSFSEPRLPSLRPTALDAFLLRSVLPPFLAALAVFFFLGFTVGALIGPVREAVSAGLPLGGALSGALWQAPRFLLAALPPACLAGTLFGLGGLRGSGELVALRAAGAGPGTLLPFKGQAGERRVRQ